MREGQRELRGQLGAAAEEAEQQVQEAAAALAGLAFYWSRTPHGRIHPLFALAFRLQPLINRRQACCHPQAVRGKAVIYDMSLACCHPQAVRGMTMLTLR